jgi:hypothetical protein
MAGRSTTRQDRLRQELTDELRAMRIEVREAAEAYLLRTEGEIEALVEYLARMPVAQLAEIAGPWLDERRDRKLRPAKGRTKDLKRIDRLLKDLCRHVVAADEAGAEQGPCRRRAGGSKTGAGPVP